MRTQAQRGLSVGEVADLVAEAAIRMAARLPYSFEGLPPSLIQAAEKAARLVAAEIAEYEDGTLRCKLCGKSPYTRKGFLLHARRVHWDTIRRIARERLEEMLWNVTLTPQQ